MCSRRDLVKNTLNNRSPEGTSLAFVCAQKDCPEPACGPGGSRSTPALSFQVKAKTSDPREVCRCFLPGDRLTSEISGREEMGLHLAYGTQSSRRATSQRKIASLKNSKRHRFHFNVSEIGVCLTIAVGQRPVDEVVIACSSQTSLW